MNSNGAHKPDPAEGISDAMLAQLSAFIAYQMGLHFPENKWRALERGVSAAAQEFGFADPASCIRWIMSSPLSKEQIEILASRLTVGETYFLREKGSLDALEKKILPELIRTRTGNERRLRIWSAGCSTGEEPYSVATLLTAMGTALGDWNISILATDINPLALRKATEGVYNEWSFRKPPRGFREKFFRKSGDGRYEILPQIRRMVSFSYLNLAEETYPSLQNNTNAMDVIFCRNVLMYLTPEWAKKIVERLRLSLVDGGWLIVSPCETSHLLFSRFKAVNLPDAVLYRRQGNGESENRRNGEAAVEEAAKGKVCSPFPPFPVSPVQEVPSAQEVPPVPAFPAPKKETPAPDARGRRPEAKEGPGSLLPPGQEDVAATVRLCRICANQGKLTEAQKLVEQAIAADKLNPGLHYLRAMVLQEQGAIHEEATSLKRALYLDQDLVLAHFSLANLALRQGKSGEARKHFGNALALLGRYRQDDILPESEGITAGRLKEIIRSMEIMGGRDEKQRAGAV